MGNNRSSNKTSPKNGELSELNDNNIPAKGNRKGNSNTGKGVLGKINDDTPDETKGAKGGM